MIKRYVVDLIQHDCDGDFLYKNKEVVLYTDYAEIESDNKMIKEWNEKLTIDYQKLEAEHKEALDMLEECMNYWHINGNKMMGNKIKKLITKRQGDDK